MIAHSFMPIIPRQNYEPVSYAWSGLDYEQLPDLAKYYLKERVGVTSHVQVTRECILSHRAALQDTFFRTLQGNDEGLVKAWRVMQKTRGAQQKNSAHLFQDNFVIFWKVLLPERETHCREFIIKFDALVWLELEKREANMSVEEQRRYRDNDCGLKQALEKADTTLQALDRDVVQNLQTGKGSADIIKTYFDENVFRSPQIAEFCPDGPASARGYNDIALYRACDTPRTSRRIWPHSRLATANRSQESMPSTPNAGRSNGPRPGHFRSRSSTSPRSPRAQIEQKQRNRRSDTYKQEWFIHSPGRSLTSS